VRIFNGVNNKPTQNLLQAVFGHFWKAKELLKNQEFFN